MKRWIALAAALLLITGGIYAGSPYYAAYGLRNAALEADAAKLEARIDFPAVRESLKPQIAQALARRMKDTREWQNNPFAGLGGVLLPSLAGKVTDSLVTPKVLAALLRDLALWEPNQPGGDRHVESRAEYVDLDHFRIRLGDGSNNKDGASLVLERRGFASWKLVRLELPPELLEKRS